MNRLLIVTNYYFPGYKAGGPIRSLANFVEWFHHDFNIKIVTSDRDLGDIQPYSHLESKRWLNCGNAQILYLPPDQFSVIHWYRWLNRTKYDAIYLNSFFSTLTIKTLIFRRFGLLPRVPIILAPRGEFSEGALQLKPRKKQLYLAFAKTIGLYQNIIWQASSEHEKIDVQNVLRQISGQETDKIWIAPNLPSTFATSCSLPQRPVKQPSSAEIVFLSRINRMKNLVFALHMLSQLKGNVEFKIYGPIEDQMYWLECQKVIATLPTNIRATYNGVVHPDNVKAVFASHHLFLLPTMGENFGHVILEALSAGCPVLISDQTPWRKLMEKGAGWDLPLTDKDRFIAVLQALVLMDQATFKNCSDSAANYGKGYIENMDNVQATRQMFLDALNSSG